MIVGLTGLKGSGKDTVAAYLIKQYQFERRAFADPLKQSVAKLFGITNQQIEEYKNDSKMLVQLVWHPDDEIYDFKTVYTTFREFLQRYGTEAHRDVFGQDFWLDATLPIQSYTGRKIVVTDLRFQNEAQRVRDLDGFIVRVDNPRIEIGDIHASEVEQMSIKVDATILNTGTLDELYELVEIFLTNAGHYV